MSYQKPEIADAADYDQQLADLTNAAIEAEHVCDADVLNDLERQLAVAERNVEAKTLGQTDD